MKKAQNKFAADNTPISHAKYDDLAQVYYLTLKMITTDGIKEKILNFFLSKGIKTLYVSGETNFGKTIKKIIANEIQCVDKYTSVKIYECDAAFNALTNATDVKRNTEALYREGAKIVFTVKDLEVLCNDSV